MKEPERGGVGWVFWDRRPDGPFDEDVALNLLRLALSSEEVMDRFPQMLTAPAEGEERC